MKQEIKIGLVSVAIILLLVAYYSLRYQRGLSVLNNPAPPSISPVAGGNTVLTLGEVAKHGQPNSNRGGEDD